MSDCFGYFQKHLCVCVCVCARARMHTHRGRCQAIKATENLLQFTLFVTTATFSYKQCTYSWFSVTDLISYNTLLPLKRTITLYQNMSTCNAAHLFHNFYLSLNWNFSPGNQKATHYWYITKYLDTNLIDELQNLPHVRW
jgi:hypothetical protein